MDVQTDKLNMPELTRAILLRAMEDANGRLVVKGDRWQDNPSLLLESFEERYARQREALEYLLDDEEEYVFAFRPICKQFGLDPINVRQAIISDCIKMNSSANFRIREIELQELDELRESIKKDPNLQCVRDELLLQLERWEEADSYPAISAIFRSVAPLIERLPGKLLVANGSQKVPPGIGPMISELKKRGVGSQDLYSVGNNVFRLSRNIELHGNKLDRISLLFACVTAFQLTRKIASLF